MFLLILTCFKKRKRKNDTGEKINHILCIAQFLHIKVSNSKLWQLLHFSINIRKKMHRFKMLILKRIYIQNAET